MPWLYGTATLAPPGGDCGGNARPWVALRVGVAAARGVDVETAYTSAQGAARARCGLGPLRGRHKGCGKPQKAQRLVVTAPPGIILLGHSETAGPRAPYTAPAAALVGHGHGGSLIGLSTLFGLLYFVQGIVEPTDGLLSQPIKSLLRNWNYTAASTAWFIAVLSLAWSIKPLYGLLTDFVPFAGSQRRSYLLLTTAVASVSMTAVYLLPLTSERAVLLLLLLLPSAVAIAFSDVVIDAMMVGAGQRHNMTGRLQSVQWACMYAAMILTGVVGGVLSQWGMQQTGFLIAALFCAGSLVAVWLLVSERPHPVAARASGLTATQRDAARAGALAGMRQMFRQPGVLAIGAFLFLWNFNPFSSAVLYFYSIGGLHFSEQFVGTLNAWHAAGLLLGSVLYGVICRALRTGFLIHGSIVAGILATIAYWGYRGPTSGVLISLGVGVVYAIGSLIQLDLAARICRPETAGTTFALLMSLSNLSAALSQGFGGSIYEAMATRWGTGSAFQLLVAIGALFTAGCWLLMPILNRAVPSSANAALEPQALEQS
jgi:predicted MFS family arabinose efflux permease